MSLLLAMRRLLALGRPHHRTLAVAFVFMALVGLSTGAYAWLMGPALQFLLTGGAEGSGWLQGLSASLPRERGLLLFPLVIVALGLVKGVGYLGQFYFAGLFGQRVVMDLRRRLFDKLLTLSPTQRTLRLTGDLLARFTSDVASVEQAATYTVASWLRDSFAIVVLASVAVWWSWQLSLVALIAVPVAILPASRLTRSLLKRTREGQTSLGLLAGQVQEGLGALRTIQAFNAEAAERARFARHTATVDRALQRAAWSRAAVPGVMEVIFSLAIAGSLGFVIATRAVEPEALVSFLSAVILLSQPAKDLGRVSQFALTAAAALERIEEVLHLPQPVASAPDALELPPVTREVRCEDVHFAWKTAEGQRVALAGLNLRLEVGKLTALVGVSGSGKSSLAALLLRFEQPQGGRITIDGIDLRRASVHSVRSQFALVTQEPLLFSATVRDNLLVGRPDATQADLDAACAVASAQEFIAALPAGYDTQLGERGVTLSGGQRQRLCLARAVLARAPVLVLDEATSNLDPESERDVQRALERVLVGRTALIIAHRLSTVRRADTIAVLEAGRVVEQGTHDELVARGGVYAALWAQQAR